MSDETAGSGLSAHRLQVTKPAWLSQGLGAPECYAIAALVVVCLGRYFWYSEGALGNIAFTAGITVALTAALTALTGRLMFSAIAVGVFCSLIAVASSVKRATMNMVVHAYDLVFYLSSWSTVSFLMTEYPGLVLKALSCVAIAALIGWLAFRLDTTRVPVRWSALACSAAIAVGVGGWAAKGERRHMQFYFENLYVSSFYASWGETLGTLWHGTMLEAASHAGGRPNLQIPATCQTAQKPPHIILIHQESVVPPGIFNGIGYDKSIDKMFQSQDGTMRKMRVETYGGASWLSEFSILAGVSTQAFGGMRQFVQTFTVNKLVDTLPQRLAQCSYRNVVVYPMMRNFVSNDKFYNSIALKEIIDMGAMKAKTAQERDRFYYDFALADMTKHLAASDKPMFTYIQTMSAHWPYDFAYEPEETVAGGDPGTHPEMHEYLRRLSLAHKDYKYMLAELKRRFPKERFLVVHYGDHQPSSTRMLLGFKDDTDVEDIVLDQNSLGFITYFALDGINYRVPAVTRGVPAHEPIDIPYLGMIIQDAAGLPLSDANVERKRLMQLCQGRYNTCAKRDEILSFHRGLIDAGIIVAK